MDSAPAAGPVRLTAKVGLGGQAALLHHCSSPDAPALLLVASAASVFRPCSPKPGRDDVCVGVGGGRGGSSLQAVLPTSMDVF